MPRGKIFSNSGLSDPLLYIVWVPYGPYSHLSTEEELLYIFCNYDERVHKIEYDKYSSSIFRF